MNTVLIFFTAMPCLSRQQYFNQPQNSVNFPSYNFPHFGAQLQPPSSNPQPNYYHPEMGQFQTPNGFQQPLHRFQQPQHPIDGYQQPEVGFQQAQNVYQQPNHYQHDYQEQYQSPSAYHQHYDYSDGQYEISQSRHRGEYMESCECECMRCEDPKPCCEQICYECQPTKPVPENPSHLVFVPYPYPIVLPAQRQPPMATTPTTTSTTSPTTTSTTTPTSMSITTSTATTTTKPLTTSTNTISVASSITNRAKLSYSYEMTTTNIPPRKIPKATESLLAEDDVPWVNWQEEKSVELLASTCEPEVTENIFELLRKNQKKNKVRSSKLRSMGMRPIKADWPPRYGIVPISEDLLVSLIAGSREVKHFNSL